MIRRTPIRRGQPPRRKTWLSRGPSKRWVSRPSIRFIGTREILNTATPEGAAQYKWRVVQMWVRQNGKCCNCRLELFLYAATFEHEDGRTAGHRDDRLLNDAGQPINGASHGICNIKRGSKRTPIWHGENTSANLLDNISDVSVL